jgi:hypothetical protein
MIAVVEFVWDILGGDVVQGFFLLSCHSLMATCEADSQPQTSPSLRRHSRKSVPTVSRMPFCRVKGFDPRSLGRGTLRRKRQAGP